MLNRIFLALALVCVPAGAQPTCLKSITGDAVPPLAAIDTEIQATMNKYSIAGGAMAASYNGRLVFARGYGCADKAANRPVQPDSLFRVGSVSKSLTGIAALKLVQDGKLSLDASVFGSILTDYKPLPGKQINPQLRGITVRHLFNHTGGWDSDTLERFNGTPYKEPFNSLLNAAATATGHPAPASDADVITVMLSQPLQHAPGTYYAYSNFGYVLLGRVIEHVTGMKYEQYVQQNVLQPLGIGRFRLAATRQSDTAAGEVTYYDNPGAALVKSVFPDVTAPVPAPYGGHYMEDVDSAGAWVADTVDLTRFLNGIDGMGGGTALLNRSTVTLMEADPKIANETAKSYYGLAFDIDVLQGGNRWSKDGALAGTSAVVVHAPSGLCWALVFDANPGWGPSQTSGYTSGGAFISAVKAKITGIFTQVFASNAMPSNDLYPKFKSTTSQPAAPANLAPGYYSGVTLGEKAAEANSFVLELRPNKTAHLGSFSMANTADKAQFEMVWGKWSQKNDLITVSLQPANSPEKTCTLQQKGSNLNLIMPRGSCTPATCCPLPAVISRIEPQ